jgi:hypothetical protein
MSILSQLSALKNKVSGNINSAVQSVQNYDVQKDDSWMGRAMRFVQKAPQQVETFRQETKPKLEQFFNRPNQEIVKPITNYIEQNPAVQAYKQKTARPIISALSGKGFDLYATGEKKKQQQESLLNSAAIGMTEPLKNVSAGIIKNVVKKGLLDKSKQIVKSIHPEDKQVLENFIDTVRLKKPENVNLEVDARRMAEKLGISPETSNIKLANSFDEFLSKKPKVSETVGLGRPMKAETPIQIPKTHEDIISQLKNNPEVEKIRKAKDGIFVYGKGKNGNRPETFISNKEPMEYQRQLLDIFNNETRTYKIKDVNAVSPSPIQIPKESVRIDAVDNYGMAQHPTTKKEADKLIGELVSGSGKGKVRLYHGTDSETAKEIYKSGHFKSGENQPSFFTTSRKEAEEYAKNKTKYRGKGTPEVIEVEAPKYAVTKNAGSGEYETHTGANLYFKGKDGYVNDTELLKSFERMPKSPSPIQGGKVAKPEPKKGLLQIAREEKLAKDAGLRSKQIPETVPAKTEQISQGEIPLNQGILTKEKGIKNNIVESSLPISKQKAPDLSTEKLKQSYKASTWDKFRTTVQDSWYRAKKIEKTTVKNTLLQPSEAQELYSGRVGARLENLSKEIQSIDADVVKTGKKLGTDLKKQVNEFLQATHAPERNAIHGEGAAGITNAEASDILSEINKSSASAEVKRIAKNISDINSRTLEVLKNGGVIDEKTYSTLKSTYKNYVPLNRIMPEDDDIVQVLTGGKGLNVVGSGIKRAKGSQREVADILTNTYANLGEAIARAEKNRVNLSTLEFARNNKATGLFEEIKPKALGMSFDGKTPVLEKITDPNVLKIRENGKPVYLKIHDEGLSKMYQAIGQERLPSALKSVEAITRFYSSLATRFNPEFVLSNKIRDLQEAMVNVSAKEGFGFSGAAKSGARDLSSMKSLVEAVTGVDSKGAKLYEQMRLDGGTTGGMALSTRKNLELDVEAIEKLNRSNPRKAMEMVVGGIEKWNTIFEDSTRLSVYKTALDKGMSRDQAALLAKNATLNFNKKGTAGPIINSLYMFSNASIQGTTNTLRAMKNPKVAATVSALVGTATYTVNKWNDSVDDKWRDKVSEWDRNANLVVMLPTKEGSKYITVPVAWGIKPIKVMSDRMYDIAIGKGKGIIKTAEDILTSAIDAYNPMGGTDLISTLTPTVGDMPVDLARNKSWSGSNIKPDWMEGLPKADQYYDSLKKTPFGRMLIGGTGKISEATSRKIDISPQDLNYVIDQLVGGGGRFVERSLDTATGLAKKEEIPSKNIPFWNRFVKEKTEEESKSSVQKTERAGVTENFKQYKTGSEEQKNAIQEYLNGLPDDKARQREAFILRDNGYDMKGISTSENIIKGKPIYNKIQSLYDQGKDDQGDELYNNLNEEEAKQYTAVRASERAKMTARAKELLEEDPVKAVEYVRGLREDRGDYVYDVLSKKGNEKYLELYESGK